MKNDHEGSEETIRGQISANFFRQPFRGVNNESLSFSKMDRRTTAPIKLLNGTKANVSAINCAAVVVPRDN